MKTIGIDIGSMNIKATVLGDEGILGAAIGSTGDDVETDARTVLDAAVSQANTNFDGIPLVATGAGAKRKSFREVSLPPTFQQLISCTERYCLVFPPALGK